MAWSFTEDWGEYFALLFWATVGMMLLTASEELLTLFLTLETMTICLYLMHGLREDEAAVGRGGAEVFRLRLGLLGALPVRPEPGLRPDGHDPVRGDPHGARPDRGPARRACRGTWPGRRPSC